jgi:hypothetical protein
MYNADSKIDFCDLTKGVQTVIMSVAFQYGYLPNRTPKFWNAVVNQDWVKAVWHLENFGDVYKRRRLKEAKLLLEHLLKTK